MERAFVGKSVEKHMIDVHEAVGGLRVAKALHVNDWVSMVKAFGSRPKRDRLIGVSVTLAARLLGISRARVHQLLRAKKLRVVDVYDEDHIRIGHMVTLASIEHRRRTVRPRRTQWCSAL
jgi:hypothetical protein